MARAAAAAVGETAKYFLAAGVGAQIFNKIIELWPG